MHLIFCIYYFIIIYIHFSGDAIIVIYNIAIKVAVKACDHEITRYIKAYLIQTRSTDGIKLYIK